MKDKTLSCDITEDMTCPHCGVRIDICVDSATIYTVYPPSLCPGKLKCGGFSFSGVIDEIHKTCALFCATSATLHRPWFDRFRSSNSHGASKHGQLLPLDPGGG